MYWILIVKDHKSPDKKFIPAIEILKNRVNYGFWSINSKNPYRRKISPGDLGIFLATGKESRIFAGDCLIASSLIPMDQEHRRLLEGYPSTLSDYYFKIDGKLWERPKVAEEAATSLSFIKDKTKWYSYFQGTLKPISREDYEALKNL